MSDLYIPYKQNMRRELQIGDISRNGQVEIIDEDRLCYQIINRSKGAFGIRTISKALVNEFVEYYNIHSTNSAKEARLALSGTSNIDKYEYGYESTLSILAKMILGKA